MQVNLQQLRRDSCFFFCRPSVNQMKKPWFFNVARKCIAS